jgi:hypothetical protein
MTDLAILLRERRGVLLGGDTRAATRAQRKNARALCCYVGACGMMRAALNAAKELTVLDDVIACMNDVG